MSARDYYQPHVYLDGKLLQETGHLSGLTAVADIRINWGARDWWENIEPSTASLTLLDPYGTLLGTPKGANLTIRTDPNDDVLFSGNITELEAVYTRRTTPQGKTISLWEIMIEAADPLDELRADRRHGPSTDSTVHYESGDLDVLNAHWGPHHTTERYEALSDRSPVPINWVHEEFTTYGHSSSPPYPGAALEAAPYEKQEIVSVLTVLRNTARIYNPLLRPFYSHRFGQIDFIRPPTFAPPVTLGAGYVAGKIVLSDMTWVFEPWFTFTLDANELEIDADPRIVGAAHDRITALDVKYRRADGLTGDEGTEYEDKIYSVIAEMPPVRAGISSAAESTVEVTSDYDSRWRAASIQFSLPMPDWETQARLVMRAEQEWQQPPAFSFRPRRNGHDSSTAMLLFAAEPRRHWVADEFGDWVPHPMVFNITGSPIQWAGRSGRFSVVGGSLHYTDAEGWLVTCYPAPVPTTTDTGTTLATAFTGSAGDAPISDFDPALMVGDLQML